MPTIPELEHRVTLAREAVEAAYQARNNTSAALHSYRLQKAEEALTRALIADQLGESA